MSDTTVVGYVRVSTDGQGERGAGLEAQKRAIMDEAERRGWRLVHIFEDVVSGRSMNGRHGLRAALDALRAGDASVIVVAKLDRLSRSLIDFARFVEQSRKEGWAIVALDLGVDLTTASGEMLAGVLAVLAQWERRMISERTKAALAVRRSQGVRIGAEPRISGELAQWIRAQRRRGATMQAICDRLNADGVPTANHGKLWRPTSLRTVLRGVEPRCVKVSPARGVARDDQKRRAPRARGDVKLRGRAAGHSGQA